MHQLTRARGVALVALGAALWAAGCGQGTSSSPSTPWAVTVFPIADVEAVPAARVELGRLIFYDPILSVDSETACGTCHSEFWGMSDALPQSIGHGAGSLAGPGREGPHGLRRNAQSLWNLAFRGDLFWDGRAASLEEQALTPLLADDELSRPPEEVVNDLAALPEYAGLFAEAFTDDPRVTVSHMASALAAFQRTFVSNRSLYDGYVAGDAQALSDAMIEGMFRFADFGCDSCHAPPLFEAPGFANRDVPAIDGIADLGREEVTGHEADRGAFRIPTLRNVGFSEPYFHNGSAAALSDAVRHELEQSGQSFAAEDVELIVTFIDEGLRDESREPQRPEVVPSGLQVPIDGTTVVR